jgi:hypothetical protein
VALDLLCVGILGVTLYALSAERSAGAIEAKLNLLRGFAFFTALTVCGAVGHALFIGPGCLAPDAPLASVSAGSAAQQVGLKAGDKLVSLNSRPVTGWDALLTRLEVPSAKPIRLEVLRSSVPISIEIPSLTTVSNSYAFGMHLPIERHTARSVTAGVQDAIGAFRAIGAVLLGGETAESGLHPEVLFLDLLLTYAISIVLVSPGILAIMVVMRGFGGVLPVPEVLMNSGVGAAEFMSDVVPYGWRANRRDCERVRVLPDVYRLMVMNTAGGLVLQGGSVHPAVGEERG